MTVKCSAKCLASHLVPLLSAKAPVHQDDHRPAACLFKCGERALFGRYGFLFCIDIRPVQRSVGDDIETEIKNNEDREQARKHGADASKSAAGTVRFAHDPLAPRSFQRASADANNSASLSYHSAAPCSMPDLITASRISCDWYSTVIVSVVLPRSSSRTKVLSDSPG